MQLDYKIDLEDIAAFSVHHARTSKPSRRRVRFSQAFGIFSAFVLVMVWRNWSDVARVVFFIVFCLLWLIGYPVFYRWAIKRNVRKMYSESQSKGLLGEHTTIIDADGVREKSEVAESRMAWSGIERIEDDGHSVYLYIGPLQAYIIPKRAFRTRDDEETLLQLAQAHGLAGVRHTVAADSP